MWKEHEVARPHAVRLGFEQPAIAAPGLLLRFRERAAVTQRGGDDVQVLLVLPSPALPQAALGQLTGDAVGLRPIGSDHPVARHRLPS